MKVGIFFGGQSREREVSFAGGRTVYDNLNKDIFEPVPIFTDSLGNFILLDWQYIYKGTIRDFYPPIHIAQELGFEDDSFQYYIESLGKLTDAQLKQLIEKVGKKVQPEQFSTLFDFAFLALHGAYGEDGNIQGILEWYGIPYSGSGILPSAIGINKMVQNGFLLNAGFHRPKQNLYEKATWLQRESAAPLLLFLQHKFGFPFVIKAPNQGSSIGISIIREFNPEQFEKAVNKSFFIQEMYTSDWNRFSETEKYQWITRFADIREGLGFPVVAQIPTEESIIYHPKALYSFLEKSFAQNVQKVRFIAENSEEAIIFEEYLDGKEFSCIVIQDEEGNPIALPPTEIRKFNEFFDYRSKYLPGTSRKITPIEIEPEWIEAIRQECCKLFDTLNCNVYARIDGFITADHKIYLNDPNTTSGMLPSSFFFHQAAEIGLNSSHFLTYIIRTSLAERIKTGKKNEAVRKLLKNLDAQIEQAHQSEKSKIRVAVIMGGYSTERHISMESGRNIYEKLASSEKYAPFPVFLMGAENAYQLYVLPVNYMLKDNADDIRDKIVYAELGKINPAIKQIIEEFKPITQKYAGSPLMTPQKISFDDLAARADVVFIALHGRPGEDGALQQELEIRQIPYNGSGVASSQITINKFETNEILYQHGVKVAQHALVYQQDWEENPQKVLAKIEQRFIYPLIAKPADDGCSSAVKKIKNATELEAFANMMFRKKPEFLERESQILKLLPNEEFPQKSYFLIEELIERKNARIFKEITGGMLTFYDTLGQLQYEVFEPSEALAIGDVLSLEEKFLAGEGQNITPATYSPHLIENEEISKKVRAELEKTARILNVEGYCRIDAFVRVWEGGEVETIIIEVNSLPGMTPATCIFHQCALNGYTPYQFMDAILGFGMQKQKQRMMKILNE